MSSLNKKDQPLPRVYVALIGADGVTKQALDIELDVPTIVTNEADLQKLADNPEAVILAAEGFLTESIQKHLNDASHDNKLRVNPGAANTPKSKKKVKVKQLCTRSVRSVMCFDTLMTKEFELSTNSIVLSKQYQSVLYNTQVQGVSFRGIESFLKEALLPVIPATTAQDRIARDGIDMLDLRRQQRADILVQNGFNPNDGTPTDLEFVKTQVGDLPAFVTEDDLEGLVRWYNSHLKGDQPPIKLNLTCCNGITLNKEDTVFISVDEIQSKKQKAQRFPDKERFSLSETNPSTVYKRNQQQNLVNKMNSLVSTDWQNHKNVHNAVAVVECNGQSYYVADTSVDEAMLSLLAFLVTNGLLYTKRLVFFTDGAKNLKNAIERVFGIFKPQIILDWYHVAKRILELLSMALKGSKESKRQYRYSVDKFLWVGDTASAIDELKSFEEQGLVKNQAKLNEAINYISTRTAFINCYALRALLSLRNSSSPAEKANDILVAKRQKHNGMSWSCAGSIAQAQIAASVKNGLLDSYISDRANVNWFKASNQTTPPSGSGQMMALVA